MPKTAPGSPPPPPPPPRFKEGDWVTMPNGAPRSEVCESVKQTFYGNVTGLSISGTITSAFHGGWSGGATVSFYGAAECEPPHVLRILKVDMRQRGRYFIRGHNGEERWLSEYYFGTVEDFGRLASEDEIAKAVLNKVTREEEAV